MATKRKPARKKPATKPRKRTTLRETSKPRSVKRINRKSNSFLSEMFNPKMAKAGATATLSGGIGGAGYGLMTKFMPDATVTKKIGFGIVGSFVTAVLLQKPNVGAGISGATVFDAMKTQGMLAEKSMQNHKYANQIKALPMVLDENGNELNLSQSDNMFLSENILDLAENFSYQTGQQGMPFGGM